MTVTVYLRANQSAALSWNQVDSNFSALAAQVNTNTTAIANLSASAGGPTSGRPATPTLYQQYYDTTINNLITCVQVSPPLWNNAFGVNS
jgi:hypothetical protein